MSSRFSSMSSTGGKSFQPPKPTFNSPKLVRDSTLAPSPLATQTQSDIPKVAHPFANSSYGASRRAPTEPASYGQQHTTFPDSSAQSYTVISSSEFGSIRNQVGNASLMQGSISAPLSGSLATHDPGSDFSGRQRSSTLGSRHVAFSGLAPLPVDLLPSPDRMKSAFDDDSEDEEKLDIAFRSVPQRARIAAIGTASRLFKGKRHERTSSTSLASNSNPQVLPTRLQIEKRDNQLPRPSTSDGMSPAPRQAVFGHRPSPSELSFGSRSHKTRSVSSADRELILGLKGGGGVKHYRPKVMDKMKLLPQTAEHSRDSFRDHAQPSGTQVASCAEGNAHTRDPPPYSADDKSISRTESLRKSQSLSTLRFDPSRRPRQPSLVPEVDQESATRRDYADRSAWEAMLMEPSGTVSDHSSISSQGCAVRAEGISDSPPLRPPKSQRLPPQKPPPQCRLPLPPSPGESGPQQSSAGPSNLSEAETSSASTGNATCSRSAEHSQAVTDTLPHPAAGTPRDSWPSLLKLTSSGMPQPQSLDTSQDLSRSQVALDVGGNKFVTLISTLQGAPGDCPRLLQLLTSTTEIESPLNHGTNLTRQKRVGATRQNHDCSDSDHSSENSQSREYTSADEAQMNRICNSALISQSSSSLSIAASGPVSHTESTTSTRRTSDMSNSSSSWSRCNVGNETMPSDVLDTVKVDDAVPSADYNIALPSSRLCSPQCPPHPFPANPEPIDLTHETTRSIFLDRNASLYSDLLDILRTGKLPFRLKAASIIPLPPHPYPQNQSGCSSKGECIIALRMQLRCRLHELRDEAEWLGYFTSIVTLCDQEIDQISL